MQYSNTLSTLSASATLVLNQKAKKMREAGLDVLNFSVGEPDYPTPATVVKVAMEALQTGGLFTRYGAAGGGPKLLEAIAHKLQRDNHLAYAPSEIVAGIGAKEVIFHTFLSMLNPGDEVLLTAPYWVSYREHVKACGAVPVVIPLAESWEASFDPAYIETFVTPRTVAYVLCSPNNPSGYTLSSEILSTLGSYLETKEWWVLSDEIYEYMSFDAPHTSLLQVCPRLKDRTILINGLSKAFAMTGWRVGYAAGPERLIQMVRKLQGHSSTCIPPFIEAAATWALSQGKPLMEKELEHLKARRDGAIAFLKAQNIPGVSWIHPTGAFYLYVDIRGFLAQSSRFAPLDSLAMSEYLLEHHQVAVVPGEEFGTPGFLRFSYVVPEAVLQEGLRRLQSVIEEGTP